MNMMRRVLVAIAVSLGASLQVCADDVVYTPANTPEDKSNIAVSGHAEMVGVDAFRHLVGWWKFDDADTLLDDAVQPGIGSLNEALLTNKDPFFTPTSGKFAVDEQGYRNGCLRLDGASTQILYIPAADLPECVRSGTGEFTISGWFKFGENATNSYIALFYLGDRTNSSTKQHLRLLTNGSKESSMVFAGGPSVSTSSWSIPDAYGTWMHWAVVRKSEADVMKYYIYTNGVSLFRQDRSAGTEGIDLDGENDVLMVGGGRSGTTPRYLQTPNRMDEVMLFSKALDAESIKWVMNHTKPYEFSAGWTLGDDASLDIYGSLGHMIRGYGAVNAETGLSLTNDADAYFGGTIAASAGLTFDPSTTTATQTLSGVSTYSGRTVVKGGTLLIQPQTKVPDALKNGLVGYWTFDDPHHPGRDLSGYGNHLSPSAADVFDAPVTSEAPGGGRMMRYDFAGQATTSRMRWTTTQKRVDGKSVNVNGIDNTQTDYGCSVTMAVWARLSPDWAAANKRSGVIGFSGSPGPGIGFDDPASPVTVINYGNRDCDGAGAYSLPSGKALEDAIHLYVLTYDVDLIGTEDDAKVASLYLDGAFVSGKASYKLAKQAGNGAFEVGGSIYGGINASFAGVIDQAMLFNRALSAAEVAQLQAFGQHPAPTDATGVLPVTTVLEVRSGATAAFENANETVAGLAGAGSVDLTARAKLAVTDTMGFTGAVTGAGKLALGANLKWETPVDEKGCALAGKYTYFTVPAAMLDEYSTENWTTVAPLRRGGEFHVVAIENGSDVTFKATVTNPGMVILFR